MRLRNSGIKRERQSLRRGDRYREDKRQRKRQRKIQIKAETVSERQREFSFQQKQMSNFRKAKRVGIEGEIDRE